MAAGHGDSFEFRRDLAHRGDGRVTVVDLRQNAQTVNIHDLESREAHLSETGRRLAAIMFADMVGYTALGQKNELLSIALVEEQRKGGAEGFDEAKALQDLHKVRSPGLDPARCAEIHPYHWGLKSEPPFKFLL